MAMPKARPPFKKPRLQIRATPKQRPSSKMLPPELWLQFQQTPELQGPAPVTPPRRSRREDGAWRRRRIGGPKQPACPPPAHLLKSPTEAKCDGDVSGQAPASAARTARRSAVPVRLWHGGAAQWQCARGADGVVRRVLHEIIMTSGGLEANYTDGPIYCFECWHLLQEARPDVEGIIIGPPDAKVPEADVVEGPEDGHQLVEEEADEEVSEDDIVKDEDPQDDHQLVKEEAEEEEYAMEADAAAWELMKDDIVKDEDPQDDHQLVKEEAEEEEYAMEADAAAWELMTDDIVKDEDPQDDHQLVKEEAEEEEYAMEADAAAWELDSAESENPQEGPLEEPLAGNPHCKQRRGCVGCASSPMVRHVFKWDGWHWIPGDVYCTPCWQSFCRDHRFSRLMMAAPTDGDEVRGSAAADVNASEEALRGQDYSDGSFRGKAVDGTTIYEDEEGLRGAKSTATAASAARPRTGMTIRRRRRRTPRGPDYSDGSFRGEAVDGMAMRRRRRRAPRGPDYSDGSFRGDAVDGMTIRRRRRRAPRGPDYSDGSFRGEAVDGTDLRSKLHRMRRR
ncbi:unnamed protein product [Prorocentrum cordatum]|uniref:Uncharacterized protein n=1 Tax=Prorocentrum cordatum TaxID=2364126 RepID=A0ABN9SUQ5_9DINO|nr:unnamed protein product [Polarella glacialis]